MSNYGHYRDRCVGRLLHFLSYYCPQDYERLTFHMREKITLGGQDFASYTWDGDTDIPTFQFKDPLYNKAQDHFKPQVIRQDDLRAILIQEKR